MIKTVIVLAHATDPGAGLVAWWLGREFGADTVRIVRPETLSLAHWSLRVDAHGQANARVAWPRSEPIESSRVGAVLNRIRHLPAPRFLRATAKDREYAGAEFQAVVAGWLAGFGEKVVHVVRNNARLTPALPLLQWAAAAAANGLPVAARTIASSGRAFRTAVASSRKSVDLTAAVPAGTVLVAGGQTGGALDSRFGSRCLDTARILGCPLLEFRFAVAGDETVLVDVDPKPSLAEPWAAEMAGRLLASLAGDRH
jgi:hypothetical protein